MHTLPSLDPLAAGIAAAVLSCCFTLLAPGLVAAGDVPKEPTPTQDNTVRGSCTCPERHPNRETLWPQPKVAELKPQLDTTDEIAALEAIQLALSEVGDGSAYVWHRTGGRLSGIVHPTTSFHGAAGRVCRHVVFMLTAGAYTKKTEGIACRGTDGIWSLEG